MDGYHYFNPLLNKCEMRALHQGKRIKAAGVLTCFRLIIMANLKGKEITSILIGSWNGSNIINIILSYP